MASAFIRDRMSPIRASEPSTTCDTAWPWAAFTADCFRVTISEFRLVEMASDAASSDAFTIREPEESLPIELCVAVLLIDRKRSAELAAVLVEITGICAVLST